MERSLPRGAAAAAERLQAGKALFHAYILSGPAGSGKHALADWMAAYYVCRDEDGAPCGACPGCRKAAQGFHPDIIRAGGSRETVNVAAVRAIRADAYIRPNEAPRKVYILEHAHQMNQSAQNALLKLLEDGPSYTAFLLLTENDAALLPTIRSRCETIRLAGAGEVTGQDDALREAAQRLTCLLVDGDELELLAFAITLEKWDRASFAALLDETLQGLRDKLVAGGGDTRRLLELAGLTGTLRRACEFNIGTGHLAGWLVSRAAEL